MKINILSNEIMELIKEMLNKGRAVDLTVSGESMRPFYYNQKTVVTLTAPKHPFKKYDVVLYYDKNKYKLHRIIGFRKGLLVICGDALKEKEYIDTSAVLGQVIKHQTSDVIVDARSRRYIFKVFLWYMLFPLRRYLLRLFKGRSKDES